MAEMDWHEWTMLGILAFTGINTALVGLVNFNVLTQVIFKLIPTITNWYYILAGISGAYAVWLIYDRFRS